MKIYLAGPISGLSYEEVYSYFKTTKDELEKWNYHVLSPMTAKRELRTEFEFKSHGYEDIPVATNHAIFNRDRWMVKQSDIVYANLTNCGERVSIGTMMELAWAFDNNKHVVVAIQEENIHNHSFVLEAAHVTFKTHKEAIEYLKRITYDS